MLFSVFVQTKNCVPTILLSPGNFLVLNDAFVIIDFETVTVGVAGDKATLMPIGPSPGWPKIWKMKMKMNKNWDWISKFSSVLTRRSRAAWITNRVCYQHYVWIGLETRSIMDILERLAPDVPAIVEPGNYVLIY